MASYNYSISSNVVVLLLLMLCTFGSFSTGSVGNFFKDFDITWGDGRAKILNNGKILTLSLDNAPGLAYNPRTSIYSERSTCNSSLFPITLLAPSPLTMEQQFFLWFDPTADFHTYSILWNPRTIVFYIDGTPFRVFNNLESRGISFPKNQPMRAYSSLWNADDWATRGGLIKTDWSKAPFTASLRNFKANACIWKSEKSSCKNSSSKPWSSQELDSESQERLKWVHKNYMVYNYCQDTKRFPQGLPQECTFNATSNN
ncbi:xyloglucan endotransglucosylase hydrolase 24-like [Olea europaea subsp. europaea]|uniref:Xyloglucan endotransglucosylase/hydrolase n=1 Tax=Olea europaea subsp. europaea TaxID=158383 RepID=A0A8S0UCN3_OLEEU|nr:xyloglucan endotransglucosylase hydrolase 24-like [Olea europaea subsp. europaea]